MPSKPRPQVPTNSSSIFSGVSENFAFHSSPEAFLVTRILQHHKDNPQEIRARTPVRAKILNRNVIILSSYRQIQQVLDVSQEDSVDDEQPQYVAVTAYKRLMGDFFPPPNLLLQDGSSHHMMQAYWTPCAQSLQSSILEESVTNIASTFFNHLPRGSRIDLYQVLKRLSWEIFLSVFLEIADSDPNFRRVIKLQEDLLRGQFSLFPASVNIGVWHSPRKKGVDARRALQELLSNRLDAQRPPLISADLMKMRPRDEIVNHMLMATSSLAVKGFASLMQALLLNIFLLPHQHSGCKSLAEWIIKDGSERGRERLEAVFKETVRLSPPIVGVLRRTTRDCIISNSYDESDTMLPTGFEAWCYFPGGNRDAKVFGDDADLFDAERYLGDAPDPIVFGLGQKSCLGAGFVRTAALTVVEALLDAKFSISSNIEAAGVRGWLGHEIATPEQWAEDVKQLPTQRPSRPIMVEVKCSEQ